MTHLRFGVNAAGRLQLTIRLDAYRAQRRPRPLQPRAASLPMLQTIAKFGLCAVYVLLVLLHLPSILAIVQMLPRSTSFARPTLQVRCDVALMLVGGKWTCVSTRLGHYYAAEADGTSAFELKPVVIKNPYAENTMGEAHA